MNILFVTWTRIGDAVLSTGLLSHLASAFPSARITVASGPLAAPLFAGAPGVESVIALKKRRHAGHWLSLWRRCATVRWDIVVDLRGSALAWLLPARRRYVNRPDGLSCHKVETLGRLFGLAEPPPPAIWLPPAVRTAAARLIPEGAPVLALGPTASWRGKQWPAERFVELADRLTGPAGILPGGRIAVFGAPHERAEIAPLLEALPRERVIDLVGKADILTAAGCLARCAFFIGNDSGPMHLAAAVKTPTLGLFGPSPAEHYAPWGAHAAVVQTDIPRRLLPDRKSFMQSGMRTLMDSLGVDKAEAAARRLWETAGAAPNTDSRKS